MPRNRRDIAIILLHLLVAGSALESAAVYAHGNATGIVKQRMDVMSTLGDSMKIMTDMVKRKIAFDTAAVEQMATDIATHAEGMPELFPDTPDSREGQDTSALPAVWERWTDFEQQAAELAAASARLAEVAATQEIRAIRRQVVVTAKTCKGCHTDFRRPED